LGTKFKSKNRINFGDVGMSWENAVHTILGGLIAGSVGLLIEIRRERKERRMKHFKGIKENCLGPLFGELSRLKEKHFTLKESEP
jgi:hypothetical protein